VITVRATSNTPEVLRALDQDAKQARYALRQAMNKTVQWAETDVRRAMRTSFDKPTPFFLRSLRIVYAAKEKLEVALWFKDRGLDDGSEAMVLPHVEGGPRRLKPMELRLQRAGLLPAGWYAVPGSAAKLDGNGNMSRGQISQMLNVLGTYREAGYNKADSRTRDRLLKGNAKKGVDGFAYWVNPVGARRAKHLPPGVYQRFTTVIGSVLKPVLIFVSKAQYRQRFDFYGIAQKTFDARFPAEFDRAFANAMRTAR
jgi:hypothetical protein